MRLPTIRTLFYIFLFAFACSSANAQTVLVNKPDSDLDKRYEYPHTLLAEVLKRYGSGTKYQSVKHAEYQMNRDRLLAELIKGQQLHVVAEAPKPDWLENLLVVRIPIRKGIQGFRLFLIDERNQASIGAVSSFDDFRALATGTGALWSTTRAMAEAGFNIVKGNNYEGLFSMLERGQFTTFGRGINEIEAELNTHKDRFKYLAIEKNFALHIPLPTYFFVSPTKPELAKLIQQGLDAMIDDGSFDEIFLKFHGEMIEKFKLNDRVVFSISNPNLTPKDPMSVDKYWYRVALP